MKFSSVIISLLAASSPAASEKNGLRAVDESPTRRLDKSSTEDTSSEDTGGIIFDDSIIPGRLTGNTLTARFVDLEDCDGFDGVDEQRLEDDLDIDQGGLRCFQTQPVAPSSAGVNFPNSCNSNNAMDCIGGFKQTACLQAGGIFGFEFIYSFDVSWDWSDWSENFPCATINPTVNGPTSSSQGQCAISGLRTFRNRNVVTVEDNNGDPSNFDLDLTGNILAGGTFCQQYVGRVEATNYLQSNLVQYFFTIPIGGAFYFGTFRQVFTQPNGSTVPYAQGDPTITLQEIELD